MLGFFHIARCCRCNSQVTCVLAELKPTLQKASKKEVTSRFLLLVAMHVTNSDALVTSSKSFSKARSSLSEALQTSCSIERQKDLNGSRPQGPQAGSALSLDLSFFLRGRTYFRFKCQPQRRLHYHRKITPTSGRLVANSETPAAPMDHIAPGLANSFADSSFEPVHVSEQTQNTMEKYFVYAQLFEWIGHRRRQASLVGKEASS